MLFAFENLALKDKVKIQPMGATQKVRQFKTASWPERFAA